MVSSSSIGGLVSGLDTKTLITQLMSLEAAPQKRLQTQLASLTAQTTAVRSVNTKAASISTAADALTKDALYATTTSTSSSSAATAAVTGTPDAGSVTFEVKSLASAQRTVTGFLADAAGPKTLTIVKGGVSTAVTSATGSLEDQVKAINDAGAGVTASLITEESGNRRMQLSSTTTGAASSFEVQGITDDANNPSFVVLPGADAVISLGRGIDISSSTNTFTGLVKGVSVTINAVAPEVTITTAKDASAVTSAVSGLVASMNSVLSDIAFHTKQLTTGVTASATNGGLLAGNNTLRNLSNQVLDAVSGSVGVNAASKAGLAVTRTGEITFDQTKLDALTKSDPAAAKAVLVAFGTAMKSVGDKASNATTGSLTGLVTGNETTSKTLTDRIADWSVRLDLREASLNKKYSALEVALGQLQSQSEALAKTLESLSSSSNN